MIKFDEKTNEIQVIEAFSWDTVKHLLKCAKEYCADMYEGNEFSQEDAEKIEKFLNWDLETDDTPAPGVQKEIMQYLADEMSNDEWSDFFNADSSIQNALAEWLSSEFDVSLEACEIFPG